MSICAQNGLPTIQKSCALCTVANEKAVSGMYLRGNETDNYDYNLDQLIVIVRMGSLL